MRVYLSEFARVGGALLLVLYVVFSFLVFRYRTEKKRKPFYVVQILLMIGIQGLLFLQMLLKTNDLRYLFFFAFQAGALRLIRSIGPVRRDIDLHKSSGARIDGLMVHVHNILALL